MPGAAESGQGVQAPYFFLSYTRSPLTSATGRYEGEQDRHVIRFYKILCQHIRHLTDLDKNIQPGYLDQAMPIGTQWKPAVLSALATCQTFVPLYEPAYFKSAWCGLEWALFKARQEQAKPSGSVAYNAIVPVLWAEERRVLPILPEAASGLQYADLAPTPRYRAEGIYGLMNGYQQDYRKTTLAIARRIVDVAASTRIAPCDPAGFDESLNAFAPQASGPGEEDPDGAG